MARPAPHRPVTVAKTELYAGALKLPGVLMQNLTHMAPAIALLFTIQFTTSQAGLAVRWRIWSLF
jgi:hypothetical protein